MFSEGAWSIFSVHTQQIRSTMLMSTQGDKLSFNIGQTFDLDLKGGENPSVWRMLGDVGKKLGISMDVMLGDLGEKLGISTDVFVGIYRWW